MTHIAKATANRTRVGAFSSASPVIRNDRRVSSMIVPCPTCGAEVGAHCVTPNGKRVVHGSRRRMALREESASYSVADVAFARRASCVQRKAARKSTGLTQSQLAERLGVTYSAVRRWEAGTQIPAGPEGAAYGAWLAQVGAA